jgi:copper chaperone CopZ
MNRPRPNLIAALVGLALLVVFAPWLAGQLRSLPGARPLAARSGERVVTIAVSGMTCNACVARIHDQLATTPGVSACEVRLRQERAYVVCAPQLADSALVQAVQRAGPGYLAAVVKQ